MPTAEPTTPTVSPSSDHALLERLRDAVDRIPYGVLLGDADGYVRFQNRAAEQFMQARDGRVLVAAAIEELFQDAAAGRSVRRTVDIFGPPAESFVVMASPFSGDGPRGAVVIVEDRSLQKRIETVRRDFVANISHELKTPIGALGLLAETIRDEPDHEVVGRLAERMIVEADRVSRTVDDLLELSRIEFGDAAAFERVAVVAVVADAEGHINSAADHAGIKIPVDVPSALEIDAYRRQLVSATFNLLDNAVKYSQEDSEIVIAAEPVIGGRIALSVTDAGIGVPRRDLDRIFERFYRVDRARSRTTGGTGLGLAIVRHVASNHGGEVTVESTEGVGSTFTLLLPASDHQIDGSGRPGTFDPPSDRTVGRAQEGTS